MNAVNVRQKLSPELKGRLEERVKNWNEASEEIGGISKYRQTARDAILDAIEARWPQIAAPPAAREVETWIARGGRGQEGGCGNKNPFFSTEEGAKYLG